MLMHKMMTMLKLIVACSLLLAMTTNTKAEERSALPKAVATTTTANREVCPGVDPFVGDYLGTFHPLGEYGGKPRPEDGKDFKPQKCGTCHTDATITRSGSGYSLIMFVEHGKDKEGKLQKERITLTAKRQDKTLLFSDANYSITLEGDEVTGGRTGRMVAEIKLKRRTASLATSQAKRILFLGNSITLHGPSAQVGWMNNWGMAASAQEEDYVHVLVNSIAKLSGSRPEVQIDNIADFERRYDSYDLDTGLKQHLDFKPDTVVVAIGENVPALTSEDTKTKFKASFTRLLTALKKSGRPAIFVRSCFWPDKTKDDIMRESCMAVGGVFVDIRGLSKDESNYARSEQSFAHAGVAGHPGDKGMKGIADALLKAITSRGREER
jgi:hypothetical protein